MQFDEIYIREMIFMWVFKKGVYIYEILYVGGEVVGKKNWSRAKNNTFNHLKPI